MDKAVVICVDDEKTILNSLRDQLSRGFHDQFTIEIAESGDEALALIDELVEAGLEIPLVICDQIMPHMSGDKVLCEIHRRHPKTLNILLTGMASFDSVINTVNNANLYRYIPKPWDEADLALAVRTALRSYYQEEQMAQQYLELQAANQKLEQEIDERRKVEAQLTRLALHDPLTGLPNRKYFMERVDGVLHQAKVEASMLFAVMFIDLDRFKIINDSLGHDVGDQLLIAISSRLKQCVRSCDVVARLGGDEFTVLLHPILSLHDAIEISDRILETLSTPFRLGDHFFSVSASIGILEGSGQYTNSVQLLRDADTAMYNAKANGKARYSIFNHDMHSHTMHIWRLESALQGALERNEFYLEYQPIIAIATGQIQGMEALLRWRHPERGLIPPDDFIPIAEDSGLILLLGEWVLQEACQQLKDWQARLPSCADLTINVNIASKQIHEVQCVETIDRILATTGLEGRFLNLELTEGTLIEDTETTIYVMQQLRCRGINLNIDDFGKGYSSLSYLHRLPIKSLKLDRLFTEQVGSRVESRNIMQGIVALAHSLNLTVVIEGIETARQFQVAKDLNCELGQGYFLSPPLSVDQAEKLLLELPSEALRVA
ncbi:MAG: diguanylate cyclase [Leptolyngbya sp.]|nr:MAG: diguanylate cyclase [Leptolyngbya sp.]